MPCEMETAFKKGNIERLMELKVNLCMECGCCSYGCPAHRPLVQTNKLAKAKLAAWLKEQTYKGQPLEVAETQSNFILFGGHFDDRDRIFDELLKRGVLIRVVGPEGWMRVCMGTDEEMARFREALVEVLRIVEQG